MAESCDPVIFGLGFRYSPRRPCQNTSEELPNLALALVVKVGIWGLPTKGPILIPLNIRYHKII